MAATVSLATDIDKVLPGSGARTTNALTVYGAKGETVSFQVLVGGPATVTDVNIPSAVGPIPANRIFIFREVWQNCAVGSGFLDPSIGGFRGLVPDGLLPRVDDVVGEQRGSFLPVTISDTSQLAFWVDLYIPPNATAGDFGGQVVVSIQGQSDTKLSFTVHVWNFSIPATSSLRNFWGTEYQDVIQGFGVSGDGYSRILARWSQLGLDHRMSLSGADDGNRNAAHWNSFYLPFINGTAPTNLPGAKWTTVFNGSSASMATVVGGSIGDFWANAVNNGFSDRAVQWTVDEPSGNGTWGNVCPFNSQVKSVSAQFKTLVTANIGDLNSNGATNCTNILCCVIDQMNDKGGAFGGSQRAGYTNWLSGGGRELWLYQSCDEHGCGGDQSTNGYYSGWTSYMIDCSMLRARMFGWLVHNYAAAGELYWDTGFVFGSGAWTNGLYNFNGQGDGDLFLPGTTSQIGGSTPIVCATLRVKAIRGGYTDYEYLKILDGLGDPTGVNLANSMFPNPWTQPSQATFLANRIVMGNKIEQILGGAPSGGGGTVTPPTPPPPPPTPSLSWANGGTGAFQTATQASQSLLHPSRVISRIQSDDPTLNRVQDQVSRSVNPALADMAKMPRASAGVFQAEAWIAAALLNGWVNVSGSYPASFYTDAAGNVHLQGAVAGGKIGGAAFLLPAGKRPAASTSRLCVSNGQVATVAINPDGTVVPSSGSSQSFDFGGISFRGN